MDTIDHLISATPQPVQDVVSAYEMLAYRDRLYMGEVLQQMAALIREHAKLGAALTRHHAENMRLTTQNQTLRNDVDLLRYAAI